MIEKNCLKAKIFLYKRNEKDIATNYNIEPWLVCVVGERERSYEIHCNKFENSNMDYFPDNIREFFFFFCRRYMCESMCLFM